ncbi:MAG: anti-sigma factor [Altererythrobacter sp.]|nr:anti-sigma factor [Altererythrobacter sp.]MBT8431254.1 anti-sigma factor [Altererythrobacter sp.]
MSNDPRLDELTGDDLLAAEYALGLLEDEELLSARGRIAREPELAAAVAKWERQIAPLLDEVAGAAPSPDLWQRIESEVNARDLAPQGSNVIDLSQQLTRWKWATGLSSAAAAIALAFLALPGSGPDPVTPAAEAPLMASIAIADTPLRLGVTYLPASEEMLVSASGLSADGVHDHELWLVPGDGGALQSLGVVVPGEERRVALPGEISRNMADGAQLLLTREPLGGKPADQNAGPVVAEGNFRLI